MGDSPVSNTIENIAGQGVGALAALTSLKGGGLQNYFINRQRQIADPAFRATLVGSPFTAGVFGQSQQTAGPEDVMPAAAVPAQPADFVGPSLPATSHAVASPSDIAWLHQQAPDRRSLPNLPPLGAQTQVEVQAAQGIVSGLQSSDPAVRLQAKLAGKIPLTAQEVEGAVAGGRALQKEVGPGGTVGLQIPGMPIQIGSPYATGTYLDENAAKVLAARTGGVVVPSPTGGFDVKTPERPVEGSTPASQKRKPHGTGRGGETHRTHRPV
jgi:hypothetical protein